MKKFLTLALAIIMVCSLFAVPTMAATMTEQLVSKGDFETVDVGTTAAGMGFSSPSKTTATVVNIADENIPANGTGNTKALKAVINTAGQSAGVHSNTFDVIANEEYTVSFDYLIVAEELPNVQYYGTTFNNVKCYYTTDGVWSTSAPTYVNVNAETVDTDGDGTVDKMATGTWVSYSTKLKPSTDGTDTKFVFTSVNGLVNAPVDTVAFYIDNISVTREVEAAAVTKTVTGNGTITGIDDVVGLNTTHTLTLTPSSTSYLSSLTVNGTDVTDSVTQTWDATLGNYVGTYDVTVAADTAIVATYADYTLVKKVDESMEDIDYTIGSVNHTTEAWGKSSTSAATIETDDTYGQFIKVTAGDVRTPLHTMDFGLYKFSFDAKADSEAQMQVQHSAATSGSVGNGKYDGAAASAGYEDITTAWAHHEIMFELTAYANDTQDSTTTFYLSLKAFKTTNLCLDNVKIEYYSKTAATPTSYTVTGTTNNEEYGTVAASASTVTAGGTATFTVTPKLGYYVSAATLGEADVLASFDAYKGGTYTVENIAANTELSVTFAAVTAQGESVATLPAVFAPAADTAVTFGKVLDTTDATSWGIELTKDGVGVTPYHGGSYLYKANATNANGQYAIEFVGLASGTYTIRSYVYVNGTATFGEPATFVVE